MSSEEINYVVSVINGILNPNNETRKLFVGKLDELRQNTPALFFCLVKILENGVAGNEAEVKQTKTVAAVLARKLIFITDDSLINEHWVKMAAELKAGVKTSLLSTFINEKDQSIRIKICDLIVAVASNVYESDDKWNELLQVLMQILTLNSGADLNQLESALLILAGIFGYVYDDMIQHLEMLLTSFRAYLSSDDLTLRTRTARSLSEIITYCEKSQLKHFHEFIFPILETTLKCLEASKQGKDSLKNENNLKYCLKAITDISSSHPVLFKKHFNDLFTLMCKVAEAKEFSDENIRDMGFEAIVNLVERRNNLFLKDSDKVKYFLEQLYKFALEMDKDVTDDWATPTTNTYFEEEFISEEKVSSAFSFIDRLIEHLDCKFMLPFVSEFVLQLLQNDKDWRYKYVGLLSISGVMSYVDDMATIETIFPTIFSHCSDPSPKIRYAAVNCINEMGDSFQPHFQANYHDKVVGILLDRITNEPVLRVQLEALEALNTFISHQNEQQCLTYINPLLEGLFGLFIKDIPLNLRAEILEAIAEIVVTTEKSFEPYTERSLKILIDFFVNAYNQKTLKPLYGNLIECITLIGQYNQEIYATVIPDLVKIIVEITQNIPLSSDPIREYLQEALERLIPILKKGFKELLPTVINSVLKLVETLPEMSVSSEPEQTFKIEDLFSAANENEPEVKIQTVKTSQTEEMSESIKLLNSTIEALEELFLPYVEQTQKIIFPLLRYYINEDVRQESSNTLPLIIKIVATHSKEHISNFAKTYISELTSIIEKEYDNETLAIQLENLGEVILNSGTILNQEELNLLFGKIWTLFDEVETRRLKLINKHKEVKHTTDVKEKDEEEPDSDEELLDDLEKDIEEIENIQSDIADVVGFLFKTHKDFSGDIVKKILQEKLPQYFREGSSHFEIKMGIFIVDDMIEYLGQDYLQNIWNDMAQVVIKFCDNNDCSIRQAAVYGVGVFAQHTIRDFSLYIDQCLIALNKALAFVPDESEEHAWGLARDNAVASLGRIIKHQASAKSDSLTQIIHQWLKFLPITYDLNECPEQHELLCDILLQKPEFILGENISNLPNILRILSKIYKSKYSVKEVNEKIEHAFGVIKSNQNMLSVAHNTLETCEDGKIKNKLQKLLA
jgi:hypothetical protein